MLSRNMTLLGHARMHTLRESMAPVTISGAVRIGEESQLHTDLKCRKCPSSHSREPRDQQRQSRVRTTVSGSGGGNGDWLRVFEVPVPVSTGAERDHLGGGNGDWLRVFEVPVPFSNGRPPRRSKGALAPSPDAVPFPAERRHRPQRPGNPLAHPQSTFRREFGQNSTVLCCPASKLDILGIAVRKGRIPLRLVIAPIHQKITSAGLSSKGTVI